MDDVAAEIIHQIGTSVEHKGNSDTLPAAWQLMTVFRDGHKYLHQRQVGHFVFNCIGSITVRPEVILGKERDARQYLFTVIHVSCSSNIFHWLATSHTIQVIEKGLQEHSFKWLTKENYLYTPTTIKLNTNRNPLIFMT